MNSKDVPSKNSLLPSRRAEIIEDYDESDSDSEKNSAQSTKSAPAMRLPIQPLSVPSKEASQLWANDVTSAFSAIVVGLPEPEPKVWEALLPSSDDAIRSKPRTFDALPILATRDLWTVSKQKVPDVTSSMWTSQEIVQKSSNPVPTSITISPTPMWSPPSEQNATEWISKSSASNNGNTVTSSPDMWTPPAKVAAATVLGLFTLSVPRSEFRTSSLAPAAINMICKTRKLLGPPSQLTSSRLWNGCSKLPIEHHWISESSVRPESPSVYSTMSSGSSSPSSDSSSVKSTSTKASSLWGSIGNVVPSSVSIWWEGKTANTSALTSPENKYKHAPKIPVTQPSLKHLAPLRESRVLASRDLWESKAPVLDSPARKFRKGVAVEVKAAPIVKPIRHQYISTVTLRANWNEALAEAILASTPKKPLTRRFVSTADWETALAEALALGHVTKPSKFDPSVIHPVFFTESLFSVAIDVHPAAIGYVTKRKHYDVSVLHPVFFTECLTSNASEIHPAALGHLANKKASVGMWTRSPSSTDSGSRPLWSKNAPKARDTSVCGVERSGQAARKPLPMQSLDMPALQSTNMWQPSNVIQEQRHWLTAANAGSAQSASARTWVPRALSPASQSNTIGSMWTGPEALESASIPDLFAHVKGRPTKQSPPRPAALQRLNTNELFSKNDAESPIAHWLHETSAASTTVKRSMTWTAPLSKESSKNVHMWDAGLEFDPTSASLFSNPHVQAWDRKKREDTSLKTIESTEMWRPSYGSPESPRMWLVNRRISKLGSVVEVPF